MNWKYKTWRSVDELEAMQWHVPPCNAGHIVEIAYAHDGCDMVLRRIWNRSDNSILFQNAFAPDAAELWERPPEVIQWHDMDVR